MKHYTISVDFRPGCAIVKSRESGESCVRVMTTLRSFEKNADEWRDKLVAGDPSSLYQSCPLAFVRKRLLGIMTLVHRVSRPYPDVEIVN